MNWDQNWLPVALGTAWLGGLLGGMGCLAVVRQKSLQGDALAHATLPGVAFMLWCGFRAPGWIWLGGLISGLLSLMILEWIVRRRYASYDSGLAGCIAVTFGTGAVLMSLVQRQPGQGNSLRLATLLFGQEAAVLRWADLQPMLGLGLVVAFTLMLFWRPFWVISLDPAWGRAVGWRVTFWNQLLTMTTLLAILAGLQAVGAILMSALLVAPAVAARPWVSRLGPMVGLAIALGAIAGGVGAALAHGLSTPGRALPTGPLVAISVALVAGLSWSLAGLYRLGRSARWDRTPPGAPPGEAST